MPLTENKSSLFDMTRLAPQTEKEYDELVVFLRMTLSAGGRHDGHPLSELADAIGDLIKQYEDIHYPDKDFV